MTSIGAPEPIVTVTVPGATADHVTGRDAGRDPDVVRVEIGSVHIAGPVNVILRVLDRATEGVTGIELARRRGTDQRPGRRVATSS